jgi:ribosome-binding factor A
MCTVLFAATGNKQEFDEKLPSLILYKPSLRAGLAKALNARYTPDLVFAYDAVSEKQKRIESLLTKISTENLSHYQE